MSAELFQHDPILYQAIKHLHFERPKPVDNYFRYLMRAIVFQQLSGKAGATIHGRFLALFPEHSPTPELVLATEQERLRAVGLSNQKASYMRNIADFWIENELSNASLDKLSDEQVMELLIQIKGVGKWTVEIFLMFGMARPDHFPLDDLGLQQGIAKLYQLEHLSLKDLKKEMASISAAWSPHRSLAARYVWAWKDGA